MERGVQVWPCVKEEYSNGISHIGPRRPITRQGPYSAVEHYVIWGFREGLLVAEGLVALLPKWALGVNLPCAM